jgi:predicted DNA-binding transcriptional regulator AlpA
MAAVIPRLIRFRDAPQYLGMDRNRFNAEVRPYITAVPIGRQGIAFDRLDLDQWADQRIAKFRVVAVDMAGVGAEYLKRSERPVRKGVNRKWGVKKVRAFTSEMASGTSTSESADMVAFAKALALVTKRRQNGTSGLG